MKDRNLYYMLECNSLKWIQMCVLGGLLKVGKICESVLLKLYCNSYVCSRMRMHRTTMANTGLCKNCHLSQIRDLKNLLRKMVSHLDLTGRCLCTSYETVRHTRKGPCSPESRSQCETLDFDESDYFMGVGKTSMNREGYWSDWECPAGHFLPLRVRELGILIVWSDWSHLVSTGRPPTPMNFEGLNFFHIMGRPPDESGCGRLSLIFGFLGSCGGGVGFILRLFFCIWYS